MKNLLKLVAQAASAAFFFAGAAFAQTSGTVTNHAFAIGKGPGVTGFASMLCATTQIPVGQTSADPICRTVTGDVTINASGVTAIGATKVTSAMLNADVFSTAHTWAGAQTFVAPILGTPASGTLTNATGLPISTGVSGLASGVATFLATPTSANLAAAVTNETGSGALVFGTSPSLTTPDLGAATATSLTVSGAIGAAGNISLLNGTAIPAGGTQGLGYLLSSTANFGMFFGSGTPTLSAARGSIYLQSDSAPSYNTNGSTGWSNLATPPLGNITGLGTGVATFLATPSSANLRAALTDETGTGIAYFVGGALGTPSSGILTNATGLPLSGLATQGAYTIVANNSGSSAVPTAVDIAALTTKASPAAGDYILLSDQAASGAFKKATVSSVSSAGSVSSIAGNTGAFTLANGIDNSTNQIQLTAARRTLPTVQTFTSGSGTYTTPTNVLWIEVIAVGAGGGGGGSGTSASGGSGGLGGNTTFSTFTAGGGSGGGDGGGQGGAGGTASGSPQMGIAGGSGSGSVTPSAAYMGGGVGGSSALGGNGGGGGQTSAGLAGATNSGGGGGGAGSGISIAVIGAGGGAGAYFKTIINTPSATYSYAVGAAGTAGAAGTSGFVGGAGGSGFIQVIEHYGS